VPLRQSVAKARVLASQLNVRRSKAEFPNLPERGHFCLRPLESSHALGGENSLESLLSATVELMPLPSRDGNGLG